MKDRIRVYIKIIVFCILLVGAFYIASLVVENKSGYEKNAKFFEEAKKNHVDMLFFGTSHVINGINPVQLYEETGYTSYNLGGYGSPMPSTYWQIMMALEECTPKLVVVDSYMLENDIRYQDDENANATFDMQHLAMDGYPLSRTKIKACQDLFESKDVQRQFEFKFIPYHDRWKELTSRDFMRVTGHMPVNSLMGADIKYELHSDPYEYTAGSPDSVLPGDTVGTEYLKRIITDCHAKGIGVVVVTVPFNAQEIDHMANGTAAQICAEYGVPYCNMLAVPGLLDINLDLCDSGHLNVLGMHKTTEFFGRWLRETTIDSMVGLQDHRLDEEYGNWNEAVEEYEKDVQNNSVNQQDLYTQLMMLSMSNKDFIIKINGGTEAYSDRTFIQLIKGICPFSSIDEAASENSPYFLIKNGGSFDEYVGYGEIQEWDTSMGRISYGPYADIYQVLFLNDDEENNYIYDDEHAYADVQILFLGNGDKFESHQYYTCDHFEYNYSK